MAAARTTLGEGRTRITKPTSAAPATAAASHGPARHQRAAKSTSPMTIATLAPLTATRWVSPVARKSSASSGSSRLVSPSTRPGSSPPGSAGSRAQAARSPARNAPAATCVHDGPSWSTGAPLAVSTAAVSSPGRGARSRPCAETCWLGSRSRHAGSLAKTTTPASSRTRSAWDRTAVSRAATSTVVGPGPVARNGRGSSLTVSSTWSGSGCPTNAVSARASRTARCAAVTVAPQTRPRRSDARAPDLAPPPVTGVVAPVRRRSLSEQLLADEQTEQHDRDGGAAPPGRRGA
jgi:hypothetical protein